MPELHCETITFPSSDGRHTSAVLYTMPDKPVRAVIQLSHGMEYVRRYAPMAEFYAAHGIALAGNDHLGHGDTAKAGERPLRRAGWPPASAERPAHNERLTP